MLGAKALHTLLELDVPANQKSALVYSKKGSERLSYTCDFIFKHVLKLNCRITTDKSTFESSGDLRINYSPEEMPGVFQILPHALLFENDVEESKPEPFLKDGVIYFYASPAKKDLSYDIFSAVFYFISRYEEWQKFEADTHGRFESRASLLYQHKFHLKPVLDHWIDELKTALKKKYPAFTFPEKKFKALSTIDVDNLYAYRSKGFIRTFGAGLKDLLKTDFKNLRERLLVATGRKKDPFDIYEEVSDFCFEQKIPLIYFFLFRSGTRYDRTVDPKSPAYLQVFKTLKENHALFGLHPSYDSSIEKGRMADEVKDFSEKAGEKITLSRQHYLRFNIRSTPLLLLENGITADFSMGFASTPGFRAGTSHPFYYYDFNKEKASPLLFVPFCVMDGVYTVYENISPEPALAEMLELAKEVKKVNGIFISVFHERSFSDHLYNGFGTLYKNLHSALKEL